ncbi:hypothetical protein BDF21DRAFT_403575 [Thamnidium elegans]|nr:hypothetical protein BDF21DRAFT_403575 [Thamnidium elegans]
MKMHDDESFIVREKENDLSCSTQLVCPVVANDRREQFWMIVGSSLTKENLSSRIAYTCNQDIISDFYGYSKLQIINCYNTTPTKEDDLFKLSIELQSFRGVQRRRSYRLWWYATK